MKTVLAARASSILYDLLLTHGDPRPFLLPANVCPIVPLTFLKAKAPFEFVDISARSLSMDLEAVLGLLASQPQGYAGILYVHSYGDPLVPYGAFQEIKSGYPELLLVDDRCLCAPELEPDVVSAADVTLFSTGYAKIVDRGYGGYAFLQDRVTWTHHRLAYRSEDLISLESSYKRCLSTRQPFVYVESDWLQTENILPAWAEFAARLCNDLHASLEQRRRINAIYDAQFPVEMRLPAGFQQWRYNIRVKDNKRVLAAIFDAGLFASAHYASLAEIFGPGNGHNAHEMAGSVINLFNDGHYTAEMAERTARIVLGSL